MTSVIRSMKLGDLCETILSNRGRATPEFCEYYSADNIPLISADNITNNCRISVERSKMITPEKYSSWMKIELEPNDILIVSEGGSLSGDLSWQGWSTKIAQVPAGGQKFALGQRLYALKPNMDIVDPDYLFNYLRSPQGLFEILSRGTGTTALGIRLSDLVKIPIPLPELQIQKKMVKIFTLFERYHDVAALLDGAIQTIISSLFSSWFIDFNPVKAKADGKLPYGMDEETAALFPDSFEDSEFGLIPSGWELTRIGDIADLTKGLSYKGAFLEETEDEGKRMMNLGCFGTDGSFRRNKIKYYSGKHKERHLLKQGDLLIANTDMTQDRVILGACIVIPPEYEGALFTHHTTRLRVHKNLDYRLNSFISYQLSQTTFRHIAEGYSTGSTVLSLPKDAIINYKIAMPPKELLDKFFEIDVNFISQSLILISTEEYLRNTRDILLPRLMSGELSVS